MPASRAETDFNHGVESMTDKTIEQEIQAKGLTAPRVTPADIEENIAGEYFFTADQATKDCPQFDQLRLLTFGLAIEAMKQGAKVARAGWNGKGMFVYYVPANSYLAQTGVAKSYFGDAAMVPYNAYMAIKNVGETVSTWVPSINDCLADDWMIVD
jgi:hypothetical protein